MNSQYKKIEIQKINKIILEEMEEEENEVDKFDDHCLNENNMIKYLKMIQKDKFHLSLKTLRYIFMNLNINMLLSLSTLIEQIFHMLISICLQDKKNIFQFIKLIEILNFKGYDLISWVYSYFFNISIEELKLNQNEKQKLLIFYIHHSLITTNNISCFLHISDECDMLLMEYYIASLNVENNYKCIQTLLESLFDQYEPTKPYNWMCDTIKFMVYCITIGIHLKQYKDEIFEIILSFLECDDPVIIDSISIILSYLDDFPILSYNI